MVAKSVWLLIILAFFVNSSGVRAGAPVDECVDSESRGSPVCGDHGTCNNAGSTYTCTCNTGYTGRHCDQDINECATVSRPCHNAGVCVNEVPGYSCDCQTGYTGDYCQNDVNECNSFATCSYRGTCENTIPGYTCNCDDGYYGLDCESACIENCKECYNVFSCVECKNGYIYRDGTCRNKNECEEEDDACNHGACTDTVGSFTCNCDDGFTGAVCNQDIEECQTSPCQHGTCIERIGSYECDCILGYGGEHCETDWDECERDPCVHGNCTNNPGSFTCECEDGWEGALCDADIKECLDRTICSFRGLCLEAEGGYSCSCFPGFTGTQCEDDVNECIPVPPCNENGECRNNDGGYTCDCYGGWQGTNCEEDINECLNDPCVHGTCMNLNGTYLCECEEPYTGQNCSSTCITNCLVCVSEYQCEQCYPGYSYDGEQCKDDDECGFSEHPCNNNGDCTNLLGGFTCDCYDSHRGPTCDQDIDECLYYSPCIHGECSNSIGSYNCDCRDGYHGKNCELNCMSTCASCSDGVSCDSCQPGYEGSRCIDIDECNSDPCGLCRSADCGPDQNGVFCNNHPGSYSCLCFAGFGNSEGTNCDDIDECLDESNCLHGNCTNTPGHYECLCPTETGYEGARCDQNINECPRDPCIHGDCYDTPGSFNCVCNEGYEGNTCQRDIDECETGQHDCVNGDCRNIEGSYECDCGGVYHGDMCEHDVIECEENPDICNGQGTCNNHPGSYVCKCDHGYKGDHCEEEFQATVFYDYDDDERIEIKGRNFWKEQYINLFEGESFPYFCENFDILHVTRHGFFTIGGSYKYKGFAYPRNMTSEEPYNLVAPLHMFTQGTNDLQHDSIVYISVYKWNNDVEDPPKRITDMFEAIEDDIGLHTGSTSFKASFALVVTFFQVRTYRYRLDKPMNTFQGTLTYDGNSRQSYAIFKYKDLQSTLNVPNSVGIQTKDKPDGTIECGRLSGTFEFDYEIPYCDGNNLVTDTAGELILSTNSEECVGDEEFAAQKCLNWYNSYISLMEKASRASLQACWCNKWDMDNTPAGWTRQGNIGYTETQLNDANLPGHKVRRTCTYYNPSWWSDGDRWHILNRLLLNSRLEVIAGVDDSSLTDFAQAERWCCEESSESCHLYHVALIQDDHASCQPLSEAAITAANNDPYIHTLDGHVYSIQPVGEFILMTTTNLSVQVRASQYVSVEGEAVNASIFTAVVMKAPGTSKLQIEIEENVLQINSYPGPENGVDLTSWLLESADGDSIVYEDGLMVLTNDDHSLHVSFKDAQTVLKISAGFDGELGIVTYVGSQVETRGLVGTKNGDPSDDFTTPRGQVLPLDSTEAAIYEDFCLPWMVNQDDTEPSNFVYPPGRSSADYMAPPDYMPLFDVLSTLDQNQLDEINLFCGDSLQCKTDYAYTKNSDFARNTAEFTASFEDERLMLANQSPRLVYSPEVNCIVVEECVIELTVDDDQDDGFVFQHVLPDEAEFSQQGQSATIIWTPINTDPVYGLIVGGYDSLGKPAPPAIIMITLCDCTGHGDCNFEYRLPIQFDNATFSLARCDCHDGWAGDHCDEDQDSCADHPCMTVQTCTDLTPEVEQVLERGFNCSECPDGFTEEEEFCVDNDECAAADAADLCSAAGAASCMNIYGSYKCVCDPGYIMNDSGQCIDLDECLYYKHSCEQICDNTPGGHTCRCYDGYQLTENGNTCEIDHSVNNECIANGLCSEFCINSTTCGCRQGRILDGLTSCIDVDECLEGTHGCGEHMVCINTNPGYSCACVAGYIEAPDWISCKECPEGRWGLSCNEVCRCGSPDHECHKANGCLQCRDGWSGPACDVDVDECVLDENTCGDHGTCMNTNGSYVCQCEHGYVWTHGSTCVVQDFCEETMAPCNNRGTCTPVIGGYTCECDDGFEGEQCDEDTDECASSPCANGAECLNRHAQFACLCPFGFRGSLCEEEEDECLSNPCANGGTCTDGRGSFECQCTDGWSGSRCQEFNACQTEPCLNGGTCTSVDGQYVCTCTNGWVGTECQTNADECALDTHSCTQLCRDTHGSYECSCYDRHTLDEDGRTCVPDDSCVENGIYCDEINGYCDGGITCGCNHGYVLVDLDVDNMCLNQDECSLGLDQCGEHSECVDEMGSYQCVCHPGYILESDERTCRLDDYCLHSLPVQKCPPHSICEGILGGFNCVCQPGYTGEQCETNINECRSAPCQNGGICHDRVSSVYCQCASGFYGDFCEQQYNECESSPCFSGRCVDMAGGYSCHCYTGYTGLHCEADINECLENPCGPGTCVDEVGGYSCRCPSSYGGTRCQTRPCASSPCLNNGLCYVGDDNEFACQCGAMYEGESCEIELQRADIPSMVLKGFIKFVAQFIDELSDTQSDAYMEFAALVSSSLTKLFTERYNSRYIAVENLEFWRGSIDTYYDLVLTQNSTVTADEIVNTVQDAVDRNGGVLPGMKDYPVKLVKNPASSSSTDSSMAAWWMILCAVVGAVLLMICIIVIVYCVMKHKKKKEPRNLEGSWNQYLTAAVFGGLGKRSSSITPEHSRSTSKVSVRPESAASGSQTPSRDIESRASQTISISDLMLRPNSGKSAIVNVED